MIWLLPWEDTSDRKHLPLMLWLLMALNIGVFLLFLNADDATVKRWFETFALFPDYPRWYQFLSADFLHGGIMHLLGNMMFLFLLGDNIEDVFGPVGLLLLYLLGGFLGDAVFIAANAQQGVPTIGASGCIATIAGAYAVLFASRQCSVRLMFLVFPVWRLRLSAIWMLLLWFGADVYQTLAGHGQLDTDTRVNFVSHGVGFAFGFAMGLFARAQGVMRRYESFLGWHAFFGYLPHDKHPVYRDGTRPRPSAARHRYLRRR
jgi:membrane associated rhomboid family serine protease